MDNFLYCIYRKKYVYSPLLLIIVCLHLKKTLDLIDLEKRKMFSIYAFIFIIFWFGNSGIHFWS